MLVRPEHTPPVQDTPIPIPVPTGSPGATAPYSSITVLVEVGTRTGVSTLEGRGTQGRYGGLYPGYRVVTVGVRVTSPGYQGRV